VEFLQDILQPMWDSFGLRGGKTSHFTLLKKTFRKVIFFLAYASSWRSLGA
jgi:hypothetical protein